MREAPVAAIERAHCIINMLEREGVLNMAGDQDYRQIAFQKVMTVHLALVPVEKAANRDWLEFAIKDTVYQINSFEDGAPVALNSEKLEAAMNNLVRLAFPTQAAKSA